MVLRLKSTHLRSCSRDVLRPAVMLVALMDHTLCPASNSYILLQVSC